MLRFLRYVPDSEAATGLGYAVLHDGRHTVDVYGPIAGTPADQVIALAKKLAAAEKLLAAADKLWADRDADPKDREAQRRFYNAWLDLRDARNEAHGHTTPEEPCPPT